MVEDLVTTKDVICEIIAAAGGRLEGKLRLYKAFYFAHLFYWMQGRGVLTSHPVVRMPLGPGIHDGPTILKMLEAESRIRISSRPNGPYQEAVYELTQRFEIDPADPRYQAIEQAVDWVRTKSAVELSQETHVYSRSWRQAKDGDVMDIYADLLDDDEYDRVSREVNQAEALVYAAF